MLNTGHFFVETPKNQTSYMNFIVKTHLDHSKKAVIVLQSQLSEEQVNNTIQRHSAISIKDHTQYKNSHSSKNLIFLGPP